MYRGYIAIHRKMLENPIVFKDSDHLAVWIYLLLNATHTEMKALFGGKPIMLAKGQLITGRISISRQLKISESKVQRILKLFKNEQQIEQQTNNQHRLITIVSWGAYQKSGQQIEQPVNNERTTSEQQVNTNNNVKNDNNKKTLFDVPKKNPEEKLSPKKYSDEFESFWKEYPAKKGKGAALKAFEKAKKKISVEQIIIAVKQYKLCKRVADGFICNPSTWLNEERWEDEEEVAVKPPTFVEKLQSEDDGWTNDDFGEIEEKLYREGLIDENGNNVNNY